MGSRPANGGKYDILKQTMMIRNPPSSMSSDRELIDLFIRFHKLYNFYTGLIICFKIGNREVGEKMFGKTC